MPTIYCSTHLVTVVEALQIGRDLTASRDAGKKKSERSCGAHFKWSSKGIKLEEYEDAKYDDCK